MGTVATTGPAEDQRFPGSGDLARHGFFYPVASHGLYNSLANPIMNVNGVPNGLVRKEPGSCA